ncbi:MAG: hypothetical protein K0R39_2452 [Symbiobacteriaceae bacterium]|nr:hypothetical protein [Symbiobacteriaceae bacterium]
MFTRLSARMRRGGAALVAALLLAGAAVLLPAQPALAHCDSVGGPVVTAARQALAQDDVNLILPYIKAAAETELTAAFGEAREAMKQGGKAAELAEHWFAETAVRLHRQGEGAAYTGLKYDTDFGPALHAAEEAVETGDLHHVVEVLDEALIAQLEAKYHAIIETREAAAKEGTVAANRAAVEAVLAFETYVHAIDEAIKAADHHAEAGGAGHGTAHSTGAIAIKLGDQVLKATALWHGDELMLPLRAVAEAAGATVTWDEPEQAALVTLGERQFKVHPGSAGALTHEERTMVPAAFLLEALGLHHELHGNTLLLSR